MVHITRVLFGGIIRPTYHFRRKWRLYVERQKLGGPIIPRSYLEKGVPIVNAAAEQQQLEKQVEQYFDWKPDHPMYIEDPKDDPNNPRYKEIPCRMFREDTKLFEGVEQAQQLTKTIVIHDPPPQWGLQEHLVDALRFSDEDERVRRYVMQSVRWHPSEDKLPRRSLYYGWVSPWYYGISLARANDLICQNLMRLTELSYAGNALTLQRHLVKDALVNVDYEPNEPGDFRIVMSCNSNFMLTTTELLPPFAAEGQAETTRQMELPSIYPLKPALNLEETNIYDWETNYPFTEDCTFGFPHTIIVHHNASDEWTLAQKKAKAIVYSHATLAAIARRMFGKDVKELPRPLSVQCILADRGKYFTFYAYQLNTVDIASKDGIKNLVWIDTDHHMDKTGPEDDPEIVITETPYRLFQLADQMEGLKGYQMYKEKNSWSRYPLRTLDSYNPMVMKKFLTLYGTQLNMTHINAAQLNEPREPRAAVV